uniref:Uncharacterized protein n=1 Tax=Chryseobacterium sp. B5 TaxID=2050562 RepID=A0A2G7STI8_9FLAO
MGSPATRTGRSRALACAMGNSEANRSSGRRPSRSCSGSSAVAAVDSGAIISTDSSFCATPSLSRGASTVSSPA